MTSQHPRLEWRWNSQALGMAICVRIVGMLYKYEPTIKHHTPGIVLLLD